MTNLKSILLNTNLEFTDTVPDDLKCGICNRVLKDAHLAPCGCQFCKSCIFEYLSEKDKLCPGNLDECQKHLINFTNNIRVNPCTNRKVNKLNIKCINYGCKVSCSIERMIDHAKRCNYQLDYCPFSNIGCITSPMPRLEIIDHLSSQVLEHFNLTVTSMTSFQQDMDSTKNQLSTNINILNEIRGNIEELTKGNVKMEKQIQSSVTNIDELKRGNEGIEQQNQFNEARIQQLERGMNDRNVENEEMKEQIQFCIEDNINKNLREKKLEDEICELKKQNVEMKNQFETCLEKLAKLESNKSDLMRKERNFGLSIVKKDEEMEKKQKNRDKIEIRKWICKGCEYQNEYDKFSCLVCARIAPFFDKWLCDTCTVINEKLARDCEGCGSKNVNIVACKRCQSNEVNKLCDEICNECLDIIEEVDKLETHKKKVSRIKLKIDTKSKE